MKRLLPFLTALLFFPLVGGAKVTQLGAPDAQAQLQYTQHFKEPAKGPEFVMPVGSGDLSAMVSYDTALQLHFSKSDWLGHPVITPPGASSAGAPPVRNVAAMSPGHLTLALRNLTAADIRSFDQFMDFSRGSVIVKIETDNGPVELEIFGDMTRKALLIHGRDGRSNPGNATVRFSNWRDAMKIVAQGSQITGEEIHRTTTDGKEVSDPAKVPAGDALYNLGLGVVVGSASAQVKEGELEIPASKAGDFQVVITAQVTRDGQPLNPAIAKLNELLSVNPTTIREQQLAWWKNFWSQSWIELSGDKDAAYLTRLWLTDLYTYAGIFGGRLPPTFNGSSLLVMKDYSSWVGAYTWQNTRELIWPMGAANHLEYANLYFRTYDRYFSALQQHARELGKTGIRVAEYVQLSADPDNQYHPLPTPRTMTPFGRQKLDDHGDQKFEMNSGSHTSHILQDGAELVQLMFDHVRFSGDEKFLKEVCAPWLRECTLFYLKYLKQGEDGLWHMMPSNAAETWWKVKDPMTDMCGVRYCFEQVVKHGKEFGFEPELIALSQERLKKLAPIPLGRWREKTAQADELRVLKKRFPNMPLREPVRYGSVFDGIEQTDRYFSMAAAIGEYPEKNNAENPELYIVFPYARVGLASCAADLERAVNTFNDRRCLNSYGWSPDGVQAVRLGLINAVDVILHHCLRQQIYPYGGWINAAGALPGTVTKIPKTAARFITDTPQLDTTGVNMTAIQEMLLQSHDLASEETLLTGGPIRLLPSIRGNWSGNFKLRARGGFLVTCQFTDGKVNRVIIESEQGRNLRVNNPFAHCKIAVNGSPRLSVSDPLITLPTQRGDRIELSHLLEKE